MIGAKPRKTSKRGPIKASLDALIRGAVRMPRARHAAGLFDELVIDNFAGGGGASMGIESGFGRAVDVAINHDAEAIAMHRANHPHTRHYCESVFTVNPISATGGRPVGLAWFSPDCTGFSRAKGGKPVQKKIRCLAWVVIRWARKVRPRVIMLENVAEFLDWGPLLEDDRPCPRRKGLTFKRWVGTLRGLGYEVEWRKLRACDYGAPTSRKRLFLIARCDGEPIRWPEPTHGPGLIPYRTAAQCIDWTLACHSIFLSREEGRLVGVNRPLAQNTMRRIAMGLRRFVLQNPKPFIVRCDRSGDDFRGQSVAEPLATVTSHHGFGIATPYLTAQFGEAPGQEPRAHRADQPIPTVTPREGGGFPLVVPHLSQFFGGMVGKPADQPLPTITGVDHHGVVAANLVQYNGLKGDEVRGGPLEAPMNTVTADPRFALAATTLVRNFHGEKPADAVDEPLRTVTSQHDKFQLVTAFLGRHNGDRPDGTSQAGQPVEEPLPTTTARATQTVVTAANLVRIGQAGGNGSYVNDPADPLTTIVSKQEHCVATAYLGQVGHRDADVPGPDVDAPLNTILSKEHHTLQLAHLTKYRGTGIGSSPDEPMPTVTGQGNHIGEVRAFLTKFYSGGAPGQVLTDPASTVTARDRLGLVTVHGVEYAITDIGLRMLTPRELFRCQGFPESYIIDPVATVRTVSKRTGRVTVSMRPLPKTAQTRMVGNSVPPALSEALVRANFPDECVQARPVRRKRAAGVTA